MNQDDIRHQHTRTLLRVLGPVLLMLSAFCFINFGLSLNRQVNSRQAAFDEFRSRGREWFDAGGTRPMPAPRRAEESPFTPMLWFIGGGLLLMIGGAVTYAGYWGVAAKYAVREGSDVVRSTSGSIGSAAGRLAGETAPAVAVMAGALRQGLAGGGPASGVRAVIRCHKCNADNQAEARFCGRCGTALARTRPCPACAELNDPDANFCDNCGRAMDAPGRPA